MSIERSIPSATCKEHLESYSIKVKLQPVNICSCLQLSTGASWAPRRGVSWSSSPKTRPEPARGRGRSPTGRWGKENIQILVNMNICAENWENSGQVFEEERHQRRRSEAGDVGPWRGGDSEGEQKEEGQRIRHLVSRWYILIAITMNFHTIYFQQICTGRGSA